MQVVLLLMYLELAVGAAVGWVSACVLLGWSLQYVRQASNDGVVALFARALPSWSRSCKMSGRKARDSSVSGYSIDEDSNSKVRGHCIPPSSGLL
jgi:hypothetical protein